MKKPEKEKDRRPLVLFAFGILLLVFDFLPYTGLPQADHSIIGGDGKMIQNRCKDKQDGGSGDAGGNGTSTVLSPRLAFFLGKPMAINQASVQDLALLPGIGNQLARRIVEFRDQNNGIDDPFDLEQVPGIGRKMSRRISALVIFNQP